jgi:hypothetical protein
MPGLTVHACCNVGVELQCSLEVPTRTGRNMLSYHSPLLEAVNTAAPLSVSAACTQWQWMQHKGFKLRSREVRTHHDMHALTCMLPAHTCFHEAGPSAVFATLCQQRSSDAKFSGNTTTTGSNEESLRRVSCLCWLSHSGVAKWVFSYLIAADDTRRRWQAGRMPLTPGTKTRSNHWR